MRKTRTEDGKMYLSMLVIRLFEAQSETLFSDMSVSSFESLIGSDRMLLVLDLDLT